MSTVKNPIDNRPILETLYEPYLSANLPMKTENMPPIDIAVTAIPAKAKSILNSSMIFKHDGPNKLQINPHMKRSTDSVNQTTLRLSAIEPPTKIKEIKHFSNEKNRTLIK